MEHTETILLTLAETAHLLRVSRTTVWRLTKSGELPVVRIQGRVLVRLAVVEAFLSQAESR